MKNLTKSGGDYAGQDTHLSGQKSCQVDLRDHLAPTVALFLVSVLVVFHKVPNFDSALQVRGDHGSAGTQAVRTSGVFHHVVCRKSETVWSGI